ncbi:hypothetical protein [Cryobacterium sp. TMT4-31]|uniref:hypothetical protein n=1 Tax=Cryobacterium sp. TMT4-31 TaxID=1259259 RepID=UPI00106B8577|nr:hypothetical protein [Cryobacterium sp. TMT4-31]TFC91459.1 hypothetical protein E3T19_03980 [Cryobacterium sp. TMT4-31]
MDKNRIWLIGSVLTMVAVVAFGFMLGVQPQLKAAAAARAESLAVQAVNAEQTVVLDQLKLDFAGIDDLRAELAPLDDSVPTGTEMPAFVKQLSELAGRSQVTVASITVADAVAYTPVAAAVVAAPVAEDGATTELVPAPEATVATAGIPPVVDPLITAGNFASLAVQITLTGDYNRVLDFVNGLQTGARLFLVSGVSTVAVIDAPSVAATDGDTDSNAVAPAATSGVVDATISGLVYVLVPQGAPAAAVAE